MKKYIIETKKLVYNINKIREYVNTPVIGVLKGDGYGLGLLEYAKLLNENGVNIFGVAESSEAITLSDNGFSNVILLTPQNDIDVLRELIAKRVRLTIGSLDNMEAVLKAGGSPVVHIKIDTGFGRFGFNYDDYNSISKVFECNRIRVEALFSHFSSSFEKTYKITKQQNDRFRAVIERFKDKPVYAHIANSCAALRFPETRYNAVRIGSAFLGRLPVIPPLKLFKIGYLEASVIDSNIIKKGENIGYGNVFKTKDTIATATVEVGYKDGFDIKKEEEMFRFVDILKYIYGDIKSYNRQLYLYGNENRILGRVGMYSTTVLNENNLKPNDRVKVSISPLYVDSGIKKEWI